MKIGICDDEKEIRELLGSKAQTAAESQFSSLADVNRTIEEEAKEERSYTSIDIQL